jgi:hypothetical protein
MNNLPSLSPCPNCRFVNQPQLKLKFYGLNKGYDYKTDINCQRCGMYYDGGNIQHFSNTSLPVGKNLQGCFIVLIFKLIFFIVGIFVVIGFLIILDK